MSNMVECQCDVCKKPFMAKIADRKRGWARCCTKRCAAIKRERKTGTYKANMARIRAARAREDNFDPDLDVHPFSEDAFASYF